ncbi:hypothetical protein MARLIPOL_09466 [Marinobacter lipolyticus SM19]|uniref:Uncharacterized protein n=1 Tax=Marinobacter lipolyticus SM19 TaxID=1318628 RepID=R8AZS9_9GAMM|nr:hypothetical protein MARLIPOL_09466 [Marinobacter lipolyticus SM19]
MTLSTPRASVVHGNRTIAERPHRGQLESSRVGQPALVHEAGEEGVCLLVCDSFLVVDAAVQGNVDVKVKSPIVSSVHRFVTSRSLCGRLLKPAQPVLRTPPVMGNSDL